jgi:hypothetical protein
VRDLSQDGQIAEVVVVDSFGLQLCCDLARNRANRSANSWRLMNRTEFPGVCAV